MRNAELKDAFAGQKLHLVYYIAFGNKNQHLLGVDKIIYL